MRYTISLACEGQKMDEFEIFMQNSMATCEKQPEQISWIFGRGFPEDSIELPGQGSGAQSPAVKKL